MKTCAICPSFWYWLYYVFKIPIFSYFIYQYRFRRSWKQSSRQPVQSATLKSVQAMKSQKPHQENGFTSTVLLNQKNYHRLYGNKFGSWQFLCAGIHCILSLDSSCPTYIYSSRIVFENQMTSHIAIHIHVMLFIS